MCINDALQLHVVCCLQHKKKMMITVAFTFEGKFCVDVLPPGETITSDYYVDFLQKVMHNFSRHVDPLPAHEMILMHDNARPHSTASVRRLLQLRGITLLHQPPCSPDFNMLDRWIFTMLERNRCSRNFDSNDDVKAYVTEQLRTLSTDDRMYQLEKLKVDLQSIIDAHGDYL